MNMVIVGGGMAGATLALAVSALSAGAIEVDLVEATPPHGHQHPGFDSRAIALAHGSCQQLMCIGVWSALAPYATAIHQVHVSDRGHSGFITLDKCYYQLPYLGQVIELYQVGKQLFQLLAKAPGVRLHCPSKVVKVERQPDFAMIQLDNGQRLNAALLVAADGTLSPVAQQSNIHWQRKSYDHIAVITNISTDKPHHGRAFERFTSSGPLAMLPMSEGRCSLVWCHPAGDREKVANWNETEFLTHLQHAFGWRLGALRHAGKRDSYPLQLLQAQQHISHRLALVGNAVQTLHPIAGQGFNLGLRDVMSLAETVVSAHHRGLDIGSYRVLQDYQQRRMPDQQMTIAITDSLVHLFTTTWTPLVAARHLGLMTMKLAPSLGAQLVQRTLGWVAR